MDGPLSDASPLLLPRDRIFAFAQIMSGVEKMGAGGAGEPPAVSAGRLKVYVLLLFGLLGSALVKFGFPLAPLILGVILGDQIEVNLVRAIMTDANPWLFLTRPISGTLVGLSVASVILALWQHHRAQARMAQPPEQGVEF